MNPGDIVLVKGQKGKHTVIEVGATLVKVINERGNDFWIKREGIRPAMPEAQEVAAGPASPQGDELVLFVQHSGDMVSLAKCLMRSGEYRLIVESRSDSADQCHAEYCAWAKEPLDDAFVTIIENRPMAGREWRLFFTYQQGMPIPFDLVAVGQGGGRGKYEVGIIAGDRVTVNAPGLIEQLVRAGLRARLSGKKREEIYQQENPLFANLDAVA